MGTGVGDGVGDGVGVAVGVETGVGDGVGVGVPRTGSDVTSTFSFTSIPCGVFIIAIPWFEALSWIVASYWPAGKFAEVTVTVKVALSPLVIVVVSATTDTHPVSSVDIMDGAILTAPEQVPVTETVKVCEVGLLPAFVSKVSVVVDGLCMVQAGCTVRAIGTTWGMPTSCFVTLS